MQRMVSTSRTLSLLLAMAVLCSSCCDPTSDAYTSSAGAVDSTPVFTYEPARLFPDDERPYEGERLQSSADQVIGRHLAKFADHREVFSRFGNVDMHAFFPAAQAGDYPGMCRVRPFDVDLRWGKQKQEAVRAGWGETVYGVSGSVAPMREPWSRAYHARLTKACASRRDLEWWFIATPSQAYMAARLADTVIASARRQGGLPFSLRCNPFDPNWRGGQPRCEPDVRKTVSGLNPRAIMGVSSCVAPKHSQCMQVSIAKDPAGPLLGVDLWSLQIAFAQSGNTLKVRSVDVGDSFVIIE